MENDFISKDYSQFVSVTNTNEKKIKREFTEDEIKILWNNSDDYYIRFALILIYTGFRINELLQLKIENIDLDKGSMRGGLKTKAGKTNLFQFMNG